MRDGSSVSPQVAGGRKGAERRWGPQRRPWIGDLTPDQRRLVLALVEAARIANAEAAPGAGK